MMITRNNYESFLVDYADGTLPASEVREMEHFLAANPDIREEFEAYREGTVEEPHILFPTKSDLKKIPFSHMEAHSELFQQKCVAYVEQRFSFFWIQFELMQPRQKNWNFLRKPSLNQPQRPLTRNCF